jgi:hypothetical protein
MIHLRMTDGRMIGAGFPHKDAPNRGEISISRLGGYEAQGMPRQSVGRGRISRGRDGNANDGVLGSKKSVC